MPDTGVATQETRAQHSRHGRPRVHGGRRALRHRRVDQHAHACSPRPRPAAARPCSRWAPTSARSPRSTSRRRTAPASRRSPRRAARSTRLFSDLASRRRRTARRRSRRRHDPSRSRGGASRTRAFPGRDLQRARKRRHRARHAGARGGLVRTDHRQVDGGGRHARRRPRTSSASPRRWSSPTVRLTKTINVLIANDIRRMKRTRPIILTLTQPFLGATLGTPAAATLTIVDDDPSGGGQPPTVTITTPTTDTTYTASSLFLTLAGTAADTDGTVQCVAWTTIAASSGRRRSARRRRRSTGSRPTCSLRRASTRSR